jgi:2-polyprenyl-3-methyl-5-hydroxy-6-metoxy-1,4-benzoquinol methylase
MDRTDTLRRSWKANADRWTEIVRAGGIASRRLATDAAIVEAVAERALRSMLDLGCGEGWLCRALAPRIERVVGIDASEELVRHARQAGGGDYHCAGFAELAQGAIDPGEPFDAIVANFALLEADIAPLMAALAGMASSRGALFIQTLHPANSEPPYRSGWREERFAAFGEGHGWTPMPWYFRTMGDWLASLAPHWTLREMREPLHPETQRPASLLLVATPAR